MSFGKIDILVFIVYGVLIILFGLYMSREKKGHTKNAADYFLAGKALPWWAIGASLIASNISAEQFIGMSGSGYANGLSIAIDLLFPTLPFLDQIGVVFLGLCALIVSVSCATQPIPVKAIKLDKALFRTNTTFNVLAMGIVLILAALYAIFW